METIVLRLAEAHRVMQVAMEATGVYWSRCGRSSRTSSTVCSSTPATSSRCRRKTDVSDVASWTGKPTPPEWPSRRPTNRNATTEPASLVQCVPAAKKVAR
jgi:hypothetical protein